MIFFDIETGPLPKGELLAQMPEFEAPKNYKDEAKIAAHIAQQKQEWEEAAALSAETGRVLAIGIMSADEAFTILADDYEADLLTQFWARIGETIEPDQPWAGWNIHGFDLPFMIRRSWILGVPVPYWLRNDRYWSYRLVDLMLVYSLGSKDKASLDKAARGLCVGQKNGHGDEFSALWFGTPEQRGQACEYLRNDVLLTARVAEKIIRKPSAQKVGTA